MRTTRKTTNSMEHKDNIRIRMTWTEHKRLWQLENKLITI